MLALRIRNIRPDMRAIKPRGPIWGAANFEMKDNPYICIFIYELNDQKDLPDDYVQGKEVRASYSRLERTARAY